MRLYHMTSFDIAANFILKEKRMRLSRFHRMNDPFELMGWELVGPLGRRMMNSFHNHFIYNYGVLCMSHHWRSPVMWAHYARNHTGICLGFDVPDNTPTQIVYTDGKTTCTIDTNLPYGGISDAEVSKVLSTKSSGWAYEEEWRLFSRLDEADPEDGEYYLPFSEDLALREVILGARCESTVANIRELIKDFDTLVTISKARPSSSTSSMVAENPMIDAGNSYRAK